MKRTNTEEATKTMKIEIYSDIVCPWCYIGERRLERALAALPTGERIEAVFRPASWIRTRPRRRCR